ncbi:hypothetical protein EZS27_028320 [termite gut metagenome]|uniref:Zinc-ribbon domain-containing protein n=1 Tax=termite gut metagenome TaxID=433724 RepID=A0A5J4QM99_9ZZZZ
MGLGRQNIHRLMYQEDLEELIKAALADGVLTEQKKLILFKKAEKQGIDLDEFEMVLEARLFEQNQKSKKVENPVAVAPEPIVVVPEPIAATKPNKERAVKCPSCGAIIQSFQTTCADCGYEFRNVEVNASVQKLVQMLNDVENEKEDVENEGYGETPLKTVLNYFDKGRKDFMGMGDEKKEEKKKKIIANFPIPNTKEDILELLYFIYPKTKAGFSSDKNYSAWRSKFKEVLWRAKSAFSNDPKMIAEIERFEEQDKKTSKFSLLTSRFMSLSKRTKIIIGVILFYIIITLVMIPLISHYASSSDTVDEKITHEKARLEQVLQECQKAIKTEDFVQAEMLTNQLRWEYEPNDSSYLKETDHQKEIWNEKRNGLLEIIKTTQGKTVY